MMLPAIHNATRCLLLVCALAPAAQAQGGAGGSAIVSVTSIGGKIQLGGEYQTRDAAGEHSVADEHSTSSFLGSGLLDVETFILHPRFLVLNAGVEYSPTLRRDRSLYERDLVEQSTLERIDLGATLLQGLPVTITGFGSYLHQLSNRDYLTDVEARRRAYGGFVTWRNGVAPVSISYRHDDNRREELQLARRSGTVTDDLLGELNTSLTESDRQTLRIDLRDRRSTWPNVPESRSLTTSILLESLVPFDSARHGLSMMSASAQRSRYSVEHDRIDLIEQLRYDLPADLKAIASYRFSQYKQPILEWRQHTVTASLRHQLFESLRTTVEYERSRVDRTDLDETLQSASFGFQYLKTIPGGSLRIGVSHRLRGEERAAVSQTQTIVDEQHMLADARVVMVKYPSVVRSSIRVTDSTLSVTYQEGVDYLIVEHGRYLEVRRQPGGAIQNGATVYLDYAVERNPSYSYGTAGSSVGVGLMLFGRVLNLYFDYRDQRYRTEAPEALRGIGEFRQRVAGARLSLDPLQAGIEFDDMRSGVVPYFARSVYCNVVWRPLEELTIAAGGNVRDLLLTTEKERQAFLDASVRLEYRFTSSVLVTVDGGYGLRRGRQSDLTHRVVGGEIVLPMRLLRLALGGQSYSQVFMADQRKGVRVYLRIERSL